MTAAKLISNGARRHLLSSSSHAFHFRAVAAAVARSRALRTSARAAAAALAVCCVAASARISRRAASSELLSEPPPLCSAPHTDPWRSPPLTPCELASSVAPPLNALSVESHGLQLFWRVGDVTGRSSSSILSAVFADGATDVIGRAESTPGPHCGVHATAARGVCTCVRSSFHKDVEHCQLQGTEKRVPLDDPRPKTACGFGLGGGIGIEKGFVCLSITGRLSLRRRCWARINDILSGAHTHECS